MHLKLLDLLHKKSIKKYNEKKALGGKKSIKIKLDVKVYIIKKVF